MAADARTWVGFDRIEPAAPEFSVISSDDRAVVFSMILPGMFVETVTEGGQTWQRLSLPGCTAAGEPGTPELPAVLSQLIAVPECDDIVCTVQVSGSQTFTGYMVYPVPDYDVNGNEVFAPNAAAYAQNAMTPAADHQVSGSGHLREQAYMRLALNPLRYNPAAQTLTAATSMQVTLTFINPSTPVNAGLGIFANVAANSFLNFEPAGITAAVNDMVFAADSASWEDETPRGEIFVYGDRSGEIPILPVDYLIIYAGAFDVNGNPHSQIMRLAQHRHFYNGFNVGIAPVEWIMSDELGLPYEGYPNPEYKKEQRIRTFIRMAYEQKNAPHTYDGHLGYVLLVGDIDDGNGGMPGSYEHIDNAPYPPGHSERYPSDYYYSCVTRSGTDYDDVGDLFIGRLCLPNSPQGASKLEGMVDKIMYYEKEYYVNGDGSVWQRNVALATGVSRVNGAVTNDWVNYNHDLASWYNSIAQNQAITHVNAYNSLGQYT